ncbi:ThiF family adenylyltransferase [Rhodococcoides fascians]|uniref:ThiF family adenylyltransferase n=1 Tax=Rhodococcoides fascians TaxID=1828 RepID=UPI000566C0F7|nr:ThiF family adenylyltransferase [Rhodococcus fascians]
MPAWEEEIAYLRETFINGLVGRGYRLVSDTSKGIVSNATLSNSHLTISLPPGFPYLPPIVTTRRKVLSTWHQDANGTLCLYTRTDRDTQPWLDPKAFLDRIELWFTNNADGWPEDTPVLDIEAYLDMPVEPRVVIYSELNEPRQHLRFRPDGLTIRDAGAGKVPKNSTKGMLGGYVTDIGQLPSPPKNWNDLIALVPNRQQVEDAIKRRRIQVLLLRYQRSGQAGVLAVTFGTLGTEDRTPRVALSASADRATMKLRAGPDSVALTTKHVYVVGAGALGSFICDGLSRAGLGKLTIRDGDILRPGNTTRHFVTEDHRYGKRKAQAVKDELLARPYNNADLFTDETPLTDPQQAFDLLAEYDLVVDATADGAVTSMLEDAARSSGRRMVTVCVQNEGRTRRVDVIPPHGGAPSIPTTKQHPSTSPEAFEAGCGEPISVTPPHAVAETAAMAVRHIVGTLTGRPPTPAGEKREDP